MDRYQGAAIHRTRDPHACGQGTDRVRATQDIERYEKRTLTKRMVIDECHGDEGTIEICGCSKAAQWLISSSPSVWPQGSWAHMRSLNKQYTTRAAEAILQSGPTD